VPPQEVRRKPFALVGVTALQVSTFLVGVTVSTGVSHTVSVKLGELPPLLLQLAAAVLAVVWTVLQEVDVKLLLELADANTHDAFEATLVVVVFGAGQVVVVLLLAEVGPEAAQLATGVGPLTIGSHVVTAFVDGLVPGVHAVTKVLTGGIEVESQKVWVKVESVPGVHEATFVVCDRFCEQLTVVQLLLALAVTAVQLAAGTKPVSREREQSTLT
jgi:hypothetical protein